MATRRAADETIRDKDHLDNGYLHTVYLAYDCLASSQFDTATVIVTISVTTATKG